MTSTTTDITRLLTQLRALAPKRRLTYGESLQVARRQADHLRRYAQADEPDINLIWLLEQTTIPVSFVPSHILDEESGLTTNAISGRVEMYLNQSEPLVRQRFSLLHEFKHVLDFDDADTIHAGLGCGKREVQANQIELIANEFSGQVLMPKRLVVKAWVRLQNLSLTATLFNVSMEAMRTRVEKLGLTGDGPDRPRTYFRGHPVFGETVEDSHPDEHGETAA